MTPVMTTQNTGSRPVAIIQEICIARNLRNHTHIKVYQMAVRSCSPIQLTNSMGVMANTAGSIGSYNMRIMHLPLHIIPLIRDKEGAVVAAIAQFVGLGRFCCIVDRLILVFQNLGINGSMRTGRHRCAVAGVTIGAIHHTGF